MNGFALCIFVLTRLYQLLSNVTKIPGNNLMEKRFALAPVFRRSQFRPSWQRRHGSWSVLVWLVGECVGAPPIPMNPEADIAGLKMRGWVGINFKAHPLVTYSHQLNFMSTATQNSITNQRPSVQAQELTGCFKLKRITGPRPLKRCQYHYTRVGFFLRLVISMPFSFRRMLTEMPRNDALLTV